jgi:hypothetical protein
MTRRCDAFRSRCAPPKTLLLAFDAFASHAAGVVQKGGFASRRERNKKPRDIENSRQRKRFIGK